MYFPDHFTQTDQDQIDAFIKAYPLAALVCRNAQQMEASHIPLFLIGEGNDNRFLRGHIARANSLFRDVPDRSEVLIIFQGAQSYISPNWYPTKQEHGKVVPTWNYAAVYINGTISFITDQEWKLDMLETLTNNEEHKENSAWTVSDAPEDYIRKQLSGIVGVEIAIKSLKAKWKLSQNQPEKNREGVIAGLHASSQSGTDETAALMQTTVTNQEP